MPDFLGDPDIRIVGYQVDFEELHEGLLLFNHMTCRTTMGLTAGAFGALRDGPIFVERRTGKEDCPGHCLRERDLDPCPAKCECAYVRDILDRIRRWPRDGRAPPAE